jgi:hypothetical protein
LLSFIKEAIVFNFLFLAALHVVRGAMFLRNCHEEAQFKLLESKAMFLSKNERRKFNISEKHLQNWTGVLTS